MSARRISGSLSLVLVVLLALTVSGRAAAPDHHALVEIDLTAPGADAWVRAHRGSLDIVLSKPGSVVHVAATPDVLDLLRAAGLALNVLEPDMETAAATGPDKGPGFGVYHTFSESVAWMDSLRLLHPEVVSEKWSLGQSGEGRDIWCFRVSDNPDVDEDEPEVLIDGMHHAREIMASEFPVMFAEYLAQNYGVDPEITWLVDNRELYVVPIMNPDGFVYNETTNPNGGGMWRKNRRNNGDGSVGVDLNRNYPYQWGYNDSGSSPFGSSETYRGPAPGSEPEVQALMAFVDSRQIRTHDSVHTYSNLLLYPWGYTATPTADDGIFAQMAAAMTSENGYQPGQPPVILYDVNGGSIDWMYGATTGHDRILSFSTEIGTTGFWPAGSERASLFQENIWPHIYLMRAAGPYTAAHSPVATDDLGGLLEPGDTGFLTFTVENQSAFSNSAGTLVTLRSDDPWVQFAAAERTIGALGPLASDDLSSAPIPLSVDPGCPPGHAVHCAVTVSMPEGDLVFPLTFLVGTSPLLMTDDFETGTGKWFGTGAWGWTTAASHSPTHAVTDSPGGSYGDNSATTLTSVYAYEASSFSFWHIYRIEQGWDYGRVQVSADGGPWATLGSFTGQQTTWTEEVYDLSAWAGQSLSFRFLLETDVSVVDDGWTIDDVKIRGTGGTNAPPAIPVPTAPGAGTTTGLVPTLTVANATDPNGDAVAYGFRIYADALCTELVAAADDVAEGDGTTSWTAPALAPATYWWRAYASDGTLRSDLNPAESFTATGLSGVGLPLVDSPRLAVLAGVSGRGAQLQLTLPAATDVTVAVHDVRGALVRRIHTGRLEGGERTLVWDGRDRAGRQAASGLYLVRVQAGRDVLTGRVVVVR